MISPRIEAWQLIEGALPEAQLVDLRDPEAFARGHLHGAICLPYAQLQVEAEGRLDRARPVVLIDGGGARAAELALWLRQRGFEVGYLVGGMARWVGELATGASPPAQ